MRARPGLQGAHLDGMDRQLVHLLQEDGRMSTCEIARRLRQISDRAIRFRLERLRLSSAINITAVVNTSLIGLPIMGDVLLEIMPWKYEETFACLASDDRICYIAASPDRTQISMQINGRDTADVMRVVGEILEPLDGVTAVRVAPLSKIIRDVTQWVAPSEQ